MKKIFVGIDISKQWIDAFAVADNQNSQHQRFDNNKPGYKKMITWLGQMNKNRQEWLICMEHTGIYALPLWQFLNELHLTYCVVPGSVITSGLEIRRGKNDKIDAGDIARFAMRYAPELEPHRLPTAILRKLKMLFAYRERLVKVSVLIKIPAGEAKSFASKESKEVRMDSSSLVQIVEARIKRVEKLILEIINSDEQTAQCYQLIVSVPGFGLVTACYLLIITQCFSTLNKSRELSNYGGMAPHPHQSGKSKKGKTRVSPIANKKLKTLLSRGAGSLLQYNKEVQLYAERMLARGKHENLIRNNIKNKMLHTVCAVVKRGTPYIENYVSPNRQNVA